MRDKIMEHIQKHKLIKESRPWLCLRRAVNIATWLFPGSIIPVVLPAAGTLSMSIIVF